MKNECSIPPCIEDDGITEGHKWGKIEKELYDDWLHNDNAVKFYYQTCKICGFIRIIE